MRTIGLEFVERGVVGFCELGEPPEPGPGQVLIETHYSAVTNGTERHALLVEHGYGGGCFPSRHGYQHVGRIVAKGQAVTALEIGDWVFSGDYVGHRAWNIQDQNGLLIKLSTGLTPHLCALFGVAGVALRGVRRMGVRAGQKVWVAGQGPIGHFTAQAARAVGARVTVTDRLAPRLEAARNAGAHQVMDAAQPDVLDRLARNGPYDFIYDCCSAPNLLLEVFEKQLLAFGGTVGLMAVRDRVTYPWSLLHMTQGRIETSCHFDTDDLRVLRFLFEEKLLRTEPMLSHLVAVERAPSIYELLANRPDELLGVVFDWTGTQG